MEEKKDDLNNINPENLDVLQDEASNYNTDSDIDDPKYTPTYSSLNKDKSKKQVKSRNQRGSENGGKNTCCYLCSNLLV